MPGSRLGRVTWMLEEIGEPYEIVPCKPHDETIKALNPSGKMPALIDGDFVLVDSGAIVGYLADKYAPTILSAPSGTRERAMIDSFVQFAQSELESGPWHKAQNRFVLPEHLRRDVDDLVAYEFGTACHALEARLGDRSYAVDERFTIADLMLGHCAAWARMARLEISSPALNAYFDSILDRPALARARAREAEAKAAAG
ncbi:glutathione S-transferase family protein [Aurantimonas sp. VKM B-3413]|uniref:glutathione S-transferase family protein n=1 Tax=Aurantimonas sp. VKM B-3413 TaxID=2779401 RepID=UPI001E49B4B1|nr:glutathione S-transferase family protein [Aurantimonas sp. VKM B-3413]MCB8839015.1 glutathione S-transferase family protein [Aurantimonas sp. VKM B-3413]